MAAERRRMMGPRRTIADLSFAAAIAGALAVGAITFLNGLSWEGVLIRGSLAMATLGIGGWILTKTAESLLFPHVAKKPVGKPDETDSTGSTDKATDKASDKAEPVDSEEKKAA